MNYKFLKVILGFKTKLYKGKLFNNSVNLIFIILMFLFSKLLNHFNNFVFTLQTTVKYSMSFMFYVYILSASKVKHN